MTRAASIVALAAFAAAVAPAALAATAIADVRATIVDPANVQMIWAIQMPSVRNTPEGASFVGNAPTLALGMTMPGNAQLILRREDTLGAPVTAPGAFSISRRGPDQVLIRTGAVADFAKGQDASAIVGGSLQGDAATSIEVARGLSLAAWGGPTLPTPDSALVVVVQYN